MRRTIQVRDCGEVYYANRYVGYLVQGLRGRFKLEDSRTCKYAITITESKGGEFLFKKDCVDFYAVYEDGLRIGGVCGTLFSKLFFKPNLRKQYNITVKKVKIKK